MDAKKKKINNNNNNNTLIQNYIDIYDQYAKQVTLWDQCGPIN